MYLWYDYPCLQAGSCLLRVQLRRACMFWSVLGILQCFLKFFAWRVVAASPHRGWHSSWLFVDNQSRRHRQRQFMESSLTWCLWKHSCTRLNISSRKAGRPLKSSNSHCSWSLFLRVAANLTQLFGRLFATSSPTTAASGALRAYLNRYTVFFSLVNVKQQ